MNSPIPFQKEYQHADALVQLLLSRGLAIDNPSKAEQYLEDDKLLSPFSIYVSIAFSSQVRASVQDRCKFPTGHDVVSF